MTDNRLKLRKLPSKHHKRTELELASEQSSAAHRVEDLLQDIRPVRPMCAALRNSYGSLFHTDDESPAFSRWCSVANRQFPLQLQIQA